MGYLAARSALFDSATPARGAGIHTDEASSALGDLRRDLARGAWNALADAAGDDGGDPVFENPGPATDTNDDPVVTQRELFPVAFLTTGLWGPDPPHNLRALPLVRENPYDPRSHDGFFDRMRTLAATLDGLSAQVADRYDRKRRPTGGRSRPWQAALGKMRDAVGYVLGQERAPAPTILAPFPFGMPPNAWGVLAAQGNKKLPFVAYSELPMATCPGAGACGVRLDYYEPVARQPGQKDVKRKKGWCYSFKAFRYPDGFARMFLNTLANYADREFAIILGGGRALHPDDYAGRVQAALRGAATPAGRMWPQYVKGLALRLTQRSRAPKRAPRGSTGAATPGRNTFMRLFVDGDIGHEDSIVAWMEAVAQMGPGSRDLEPGSAGVLVYGYSKCWQQLVNVDSYLGGKWPSNYVVNLSSGSVYFSAKYDAVRQAAERLPITRGYFEAVPLHDYIPQLARQSELIAKNPQAVIPLPPARDQHFAFDAERIRAFLRLNSVRTPQELLALLPDAPLPRTGRGELRPLTETQVRHLAYTHYLDRLVANPHFGAIVRREMYRDQEPAAERAFLDEYESNQRKRLERALAGGAVKDEGITRDALRDKALALVLHETLWTFGLGGSCPLLCSSCSSHPTDPTLGVHRCADMGVFKGKVIAIGLH